MFSPNKNVELEINSSDNKNLDPLTIWLIRLACIFIIIFFLGILIGLPVLLSLVNNQLNSIAFSSKELARSLLENYLS